MISKIRRKLFNFIQGHGEEDYYDTSVECCTKCGAALELQKGFDSNQKYWVCKGCGMLLYNPNSDLEDGVTWFCDRCNAVISDQEGFNIDCGEWECKECGYINPINSNEIYATEDEFQRAYNSPFRGLSNEDVMKLMMYEDMESINGRADIVRVKNIANNQIYVKKYLRTYDESIYRFLANNPINHIPKIEELFVTDNCLIVIEENIAGNTLAEMLDNGVIDHETAIDIIRQLCFILSELHRLNPPIIHRDIKPSNIILRESEVFLLDINVAKWNKEGESEDTELLGTQYYAAPEQYGFGYAASSDKTDIYALGMLLNKMITGKFPKEQKAEGKMWKIIERCICLEPENRYNDEELLAAICGL